MRVKYLAIGVSVLTVLLCACLLLAFLSARALDAVGQPLRAAEPYLAQEDWAALRPLLGEARARWEASHNFFGSILSHAELDQVDECFHRVSAYAAQEDLPELAASCAELGGMLEHLRRMDLPHYYNIF